MAFDTIGAVLTDPGWRRVEVAHEAHRPGTALAVEVAAFARGSPRATVQVGDLEVGPQQGHSLTDGTAGYLPEPGRPSPDRPNPGLPVERSRPGRELRRVVRLFTIQGVVGV